MRGLLYVGQAPGSKNSPGKLQNKNPKFPFEGNFESTARPPGREALGPLNMLVEDSAVCKAPPQPRGAPLTGSPNILTF